MQGDIIKGLKPHGRKVTNIYLKEGKKVVLH